MDAIENVLEKRGVMNTDEMRRGIEGMPLEAYEARVVLRALALHRPRRTSRRRASSRPERSTRGLEAMTFAPGDERAGRRRAQHEGHHRTPGYLKGKAGRIERASRRVHEPRDAGVRRRRAPRLRLYLVEFDGPIWPVDEPDRVFADLLRALAGASGVRRTTITTTRTIRSAATVSRAAAARVRALEELLVEKGVARRTRRSERTSTGSSRARRRTARVSWRAPGSDPAFKERPSTTRARRHSRLGLDPGPSPVVVALENTEHGASHGRLHALLLLPKVAPRAAAGLVQEPALPVTCGLGPPWRPRRVRRRARRRGRGAGSWTRRPTSATS